MMKTTRKSKTNKTSTLSAPAKKDKVVTVPFWDTQNAVPQKTITTISWNGLAFLASILLTRPTNLSFRHK